MWICSVKGVSVVDLALLEDFGILEQMIQVELAAREVQVSGVQEIMIIPVLAVQVVGILLGQRVETVDIPLVVSVHLVLVSPTMQEIFVVLGLDVLVGLETLILIQVVVREGSLETLAYLVTTIWKQIRAVGEGNFKLGW